MLNITQWQTSGHYHQYSAQQHRIFYRTEGAGDVLLLLHGFPSCSWDWHKVWQPLAQHYRLITLDLLGLGFSDKPKNHAYSIFEQADIVESLLKEQHITRCRVLAHDYGDTVFQELLARQIEGTLSFEITRCAMLNGGIFHGVHRPLFAQKLLASPFGKLASRLMSQFTFNHSFRKIFGANTQPHQEELDQLWQANIYQQGTHNAYRLIRYMDERRQHAQRWGGALIDSPIPLRLIDGVDDPISGGHLSDYYETHMPKPDSIRLTGIGHYPQLEAPEQVLEHVLDFMR